MMTLGLLLISFANLSSKTKDELPVFENIKNCEDYIIKSENKYPNIIKNTEKTILFSNKDKEKTEFAIVYIHGFSASRQEISPVIERLSKRLNVNVFFTRLRGHGLSSIDMKEATAKNLIYDTSEAIEIGKQLGEKLIVVGNSVGAPLALLMSKKYKDYISYYIFLSPCFSLKDKRSELLTLPLGIGHLIARISVGGTYSFEPSNELHKKYWTEEYPSSAIVEMMKAIKTTKEINFNELDIPTQIIYNPNDKLIDTDEIVKLFNKLGSQRKELKTLYSVNGHNMTGDINSSENTEKTITLIENFINNH